MNVATCAASGCSKELSVPDSRPMNLRFCCSEACRNEYSRGTPFGIDVEVAPLVGVAPVVGMRPVMVSAYQRKAGGGTKKVEKGEGVFHCWGVGSEEGVGNYTTAIVEFPDGTVDSVHTSMMRFLDRS